ncbi:hypothetical protein QBC45DRAFT_391996 [Copromyces sp. CBS 386.78]|nr:hypothetical protein QBC45DRAFT_391996 [Copromyces sp. CBS 386.78]
MTAQVPPTTTIPSSAAAATAAIATTWNPTQTHTIAEYFVKYSMETIPESLNGELPPLPKSGPSHGSSRGHTYNNNNNNNNNHHHGQNLHVPKRSNTYTVSTSSAFQNKHQQRYAGAESQSQQQQQQQPPSSLNRSLSSPLSPLSDSSGLGSRMVGGGKSTQSVREWMKRSNSSRTESKSKAGRSSSNSGHQTLEIIHLGGGRLESNGHVHSSSLSSNFLAPTSQQSQTGTSRANSIDSRVTQWSDLYHDPPESLTVITKPAIATGKPSRPVSPELHQRPLLRDLGSEGGSGGHGEGYQSQHRHTKSDGSVHPAPLRVPSNSSSSSSLNKKDGGAAVTKPEETWKPQGQGLTRSNSKWKPLPVPPPPGAPGGITPLVDGGSGRRTDEDNINMTGAIGISPLTSVESESEFGEREDTPRQQQGYAVQQSESKARKPSPHTDASLGIGYAVGLGVLSPPLTPPEREHYEREAVEPGSATTTCTYGIRETMWPVPPSSQQPAGYPLRSATAPPEKQRQHQYEHQHQHHQQKPSTSSSLASASTLASSQSVPTHVIPKRSDSLSYSRSRQHRPQISTSTSSSSSSSSSRSTDKTSPSGTWRDRDQQATTATRAEAITITSTAAAAAAVAQIQVQLPQPQHLQTPTVTPPTPIVQVQVPTPTTATVPTPTPTTPTWSPRAYLSSQEMIWLHANYRGITAFMAAWGLQNGLSDEWEREEALGIMRELMAAEHKSNGEEKTSSSAAAKIKSGPFAGPFEAHVDDGKSWLDFEHEASPGRAGACGPVPGEKRNMNTKGDNVNVKEIESEKEKDKEKKGRVNGGALGYYAALKGQGVQRVKPGRSGGQGDACARRIACDNAEEEHDEGSDFI